MDTKERTLNGAEHKRKGSKVSSRTLPHPHTDTHTHSKKKAKKGQFSSIGRIRDRRAGSLPIDVRDVAEPTRQSFN